MNLVAWIIFGFIAGTIAKMLHPGRDPGGCIVTILLGVGGAMVGGWIGTRLGWGGVDEWSWRALGLAVMGSLAILIAFRILFGKRRD
ncbi:MAG: GlsB/YeaQ/YmgE family stress response membrane protein [Gemmatimonadetes bacterium]|uniref:GlsB/YeaQ/YmgE family stress response membrane protein n=1 Tax=Candidatus Kutchimonas denitrificans TaxID=3056748 RepID=A0AAE5CBI9_9BACT|nr:GlsB/YeaQ/YmgE family stress response membrane protein [Gemmatimonadota bacterium]NIR74490.1 GlsB/YeaQ/YmgE family stress response membrane protein [Candidatus Kutchimonas denitrificans]NIS02680.1 GlsB/YeaQ/YmgE family stress response membrane protein [Gemmatimonadota bacterium]NIT68841.1 GlsB/YeaQ/YmgE family stress response membrane protein [Gemmatimonadota bacterium]NIU52146.1 GlsB/YeaQ/YmgE family stress response membrane protein [Gemmatimonadota bacterium]